MNRVVMVTRGRIGDRAGLAARFVSLGDRVIALDMDQVGLASLADRLASRDLLPAVADVTVSPRSWRWCLPRSAVRFGHPDILVNNAGTRPVARERRPCAKPP